MSKQQISEEREDLVENISSRLTKARNELESQKTDLKDFEDSVRALESKYEDFSEDEKEAFSTAIESLADEVSSEQSPSDILQYQERLTEAFREPLIKSTQQSVISFYEAVGIDPSELDEKHLSSRISASVSSSAQSKRAAAAELKDMTKTAREGVLRAVENELRERDPPPADPEQLIKLVTSIEKQYDSLEDVADVLGAAEWAPSDLERPTQWPVVRDPSQEISEIESLVRSIEEKQSEISDIVPSNRAVRQELSKKERRLAQNPQPVLLEIDESLAECTRQSEVLANIEKVNGVIDPAQEDGEFFDVLEDIQTVQPDTVEELLTRTDQLVEKYHDWEEDIAQQWLEKESILHGYINRLDAEPPESVSDALSSQDPIDDPAEAILILRRAEDWITQEEDELLEQVSPESREIVRNLLTDGRHSLSSGEIDALADVVDLFDLQVIIDE